MRRIISNSNTDTLSDIILRRLLFEDCCFFLYLSYSVNSFAKNFYAEFLDIPEYGIFPRRKLSDLANCLNVGEKPTIEGPWELNIAKKRLDL